MSVPSEMACIELVELLTEYPLEGTLPSITTLGRLTEEDLSEDAKRGLLRIFRDLNEEPPTGQDGRV